MNKKIYETIVVGAGPAGLYAGILLGLRHIDTLILEASDSVGGQLTKLYPTKKITDIPGCVEITAGDLIKNLSLSLSQYQEYVKLEFNKSVSSIEKDSSESEQVYILKTINNEEYFARTIIISSGNGAFKPRKFELENVRIPNSFIKYSVINPYLYKDKNVLILGGGDTALDYANLLSDYTNKITLVHRRDQFRGNDDTLMKIKEKNVSVLTPYTITNIEKNEENINVEIHGPHDNKTLKNIDLILVCYGLEAGEQIQGGLEYDQLGIKVNPNAGYTTNLDNVYSCGNVCSYPFKNKNLASAFGEIATISAVISMYLYPQKAPVVYSSLIKNKV